MTIWIWNPKWMTVEERGFLPLEVATLQIDRILVATGLIDSRAEAQRLIKQGAVSWRKADDSDWVKVKDFRQELEQGWPWHIRVGNGNWRLVARKQEPGKPTKSGWDAKSGIHTVMAPSEGQTIEEWTEMWR